VSRLIDGVLAAPDCYENESIASGLLEYPQYTRPYEWHGVKVPDVLISGHHANIDKWRHEQSLKITAEKRPDLLETQK
jgi:tRNA (guanine37-N1)-methyltransferase